MPCLFFSVGEPSGDVHAGALVARLQSLAPDVECVGLGGPRMRAAGCRLLEETTSQAVMGFSRALGNYAMFRRRFHVARRHLAEYGADAVVLVDFPGFNWHVAEAAKQLGIPVFYFMPPQIWAWGSWRVEKMRRLVDHVLSPLEFEHRWFERNGIPSTFIGHPFLESIRTAPCDANFLEQIYRETHAPILTLLPGSRHQEVDMNWSIMARTLERVMEEVAVAPIVAAFSVPQAERIAIACQERQLKVPIYVGKTAELIRAADVALSVSGSVSMELLAAGTPTVIVYKLGWWSLQGQRWLRRSRFITLVNLLQMACDQRDDELFFPRLPIPTEPTFAERDSMAMPEFLASCDRSVEMASLLASWLKTPALLAARKLELLRLLEYADATPSPITLAAETLLGRLM